MISRGGTALVGICKQFATTSSLPPRITEFNFSLSQSYILEFGDRYMWVVVDGAYVTNAPLPITAATQSNPATITVTGSTAATGDWVFVTGVAGMTQLNGRTFPVQSRAGDVLTLADPIIGLLDSTGYGAYISGGTAAQIFTLATPYAAVDLPYLKFTQSADVMSLVCVNQITGTDYPPQELTRLAANNWTIAPPGFGSSIGAPGGVNAAASVGGGTVAYGYVITAIDANTGNESVASTIAVAHNSVDIALTFGTVTVSWLPVTNAQSYNVYKTVPDFTNTGNFSGQRFGYAGSTEASAISWQDTNIIPDYTVTPPTNVNPFQSTGNYPGTVSYFQQRRFYASTFNQPDTYFASQPGSYRNFDASDPPQDDDSITGNPWATQVNGVQWMLPMPGGLIVGTGKDTWQLAGTSGPGSAITPSQQSAQAQESVGFNSTVGPIKIDYDIIYLQSLGTVVRDLKYNFYFNIYAGNDITVMSSHLFQNYQLVQWAWAREPHKVLWAVRSDGKLLSLTYEASQEVRGWCRHDTNGQFVAVSTASEPPANAIYLVVKRFIAGRSAYAYFLERMDNRLWQNVEQSWCVDCGLSLPQTFPAATLQPISAELPGGLDQPVITLGGSGYTAPSVEISDPTGSGGSLTPILSSGVITGFTVVAGSGYTQPQFTIRDATGSGAIIAPTLDQRVSFFTDVPYFSIGHVGYVIRAGGGMAVVSQYVSSTLVVVEMIAPITATFPNDPNNVPMPCPPGTWTITLPVSTITNLYHLEGMTVAILADGSVVPNQVVTNGTITLPQPASQVTIGLPFLPQLQSMHADLPGEMVQGKRKRVPSVTVRFANSRGVKVGQDQPIAAATQNQAETPWNQFPNFMTEVDDRRNSIGAGNAIPLFTGDKFFVLGGDYSTQDEQASPGMIAVQQDYPLPVEVLAFAPNLTIMDRP
jgi:hypothetical protein